MYYFLFAYSVEDDDAHVASDRNNEVAFDIKHNMVCVCLSLEREGEREGGREGGREGER